MADRDLHRVPLHHQQQQHRYPGGMKQIRPQSGGPTKSQILAVVTLLPLTGTLLGLAGIILTGTLIALTIATPLFVIFSPILVPAALLLAGAVTAFLTSGAFGLTGLSSITWLFNSFRQTTGQEPLEYVKHKVHEATVEVGEKTKQMGETIKSKAQPAEGGAQGKESAAAK